MNRRVWMTVLVLTTALLVLPSSSSAANWTCRGSAVKLNLLGATLAEPVIANAPADPCAEDAAGQVSLAFPVLGLSTQDVFAATDQQPSDLTPSDVATPTATAGAAGLQLNTGGITVSVNGADSAVSASCVSGAPQFASTGHVAQVTINGTVITLDPTLEQITQVLSGALGELIDVRLNEVVQSPTGITRNAVHVIVSLAGAPIFELWAGTSSIGTNGLVCVPVPPNCPVGTHVDPVSNTCVPDPPNCPAGTHYDLPSNTCVQDAPNCPPGTHVDAVTHLCVQDAPSCPPGTTYDPVGMTCAQNPPDCPAGSIYNPPTMTCVAGPPNCPAGTAFDPPSSACVPTAASCPAGSRFDAAHHVCVVNGPPCPSGSTFVTSLGVCVVLVTVPAGSQPIGGTVITLTDARKKYKSPCLNGPGPNTVVIGTNGRNHITGTDHADRILGLGGGDSIDGGRGNDCIDGGTGNDTVAGGIGDDRLYGQTGSDNVAGGLGKDRLFGGTGNDHLVGGSGTDFEDAGPGNDTVNSNFGADVIKGGPGRDHINVATAGPPAHVDCGSGHDDKVRLNPKEIKLTKGCEHIASTGPVKGHA